VIHPQARSMISIRDTALIGLGMLGSRLGFRVRSIGVTGQYTVVNWPSYFTCDKWAY